MEINKIIKREVEQCIKMRPKKLARTGKTLYSM